MRKARNLARSKDYGRVVLWVVGIKDVDRAVRSEEKARTWWRCGVWSTVPSDVSALCGECLVEGESDDKLIRYRRKDREARMLKDGEERIVRAGGGELACL